jgi:transcriptional regulator with XRE-family HTH domain
MSTFFASNLSFLRKKKGLTQIEVATALGLKRNTFSNYETTHSEPDLGTLEKIASFFDIPINEAKNLLYVNFFCKQSVFFKEKKGVDPNRSRDCAGFEA